MLPFAILVLAMAVLPMLAPAAWERRWFQGLVVACCAGPVSAYLLYAGQAEAVAHSAGEYVTFIATLAALFVAAGGVYVTADFEATPKTNVTFVLIGSVLASAIGTTGASMLLIRPLLRTNSERRHRAHLVPFFILTVANAGGLLTPLGDPPLLVGYISGVPFFWTLRLLPVWLLYVGTGALGLYLTDRRAHARETATDIARDRRETRPLEIRGWRNVGWLGAVILAVFLPPIVRETALVGIALASYFGTPRELHRENGFSLGPIVEVGVLFAGLFACLVPIEAGLAMLAPSLPFQKSWQLFWASGALSAVLDNAPTYAAFGALARGLSAGQHDLVAGIKPLALAAISAGTVVMGATTYIGNGPNLMVKAIAERSGYTLPSFFRYALFAFSASLLGHIVMTLALAWLER